MAIFGVIPEWVPWGGQGTDLSALKAEEMRMKLEKTKMMAAQSAQNHQQATNNPYGQLGGNGYASNNNLGVAQTITTQPWVAQTPVLQSGTSGTYNIYPGNVAYGAGGSGGYLGQAVTTTSTGIPGSQWGSGYITLPTPTWNPKTGDVISYKYVEGFGWQLEDVEQPYRAPPVPGFSMEELETAQDFIEDIEQGRRLEKA